MASHSLNGERNLDSPIIDERNMARLIEQIRQMAPFYTPEWRFTADDPDPGSALALMFAHLLEGNIRRLNQVPYKNFLAFLNRFHVELAQARPAMAQVTFTLAEGTPDAVYVERGTQLAAQVRGESEPVLFETVRPVLLTTARLTDMYHVSPRRDRIVQIADELLTPVNLDRDGTGAPLFGLEGNNLQEHAFYLKHDYLFLLRHPAYLEFTVFNQHNEHAVPETVALLADKSKVVWEFYSDGEWVPFDRVYGGGSMIRLIKLRHIPIDRAEHHGITGYWIRCRAFSLDEWSGNAALGKVQLDRLLIKSEYASPNDDDGIIPERLYYNDIQIDAEEGCEPFGDFFAQYGLFYISNEEAFSKRGARISLRFDMEFAQHRLMPDKPPQINWKPIMKRHEVDKTEIPDPVTIAVVQWEYWNGHAWVRLPVNTASQQLFAVPWEGVESRELTFVCPEDLEPIFVNAEENYWIRARIIQINNAYSPNAIYFSPVLHRMRIRYGYDRPLYSPQHMVTLNNLELKDRTHEIQSGGVTFRPFTLLAGKSPAVWLGFDKPPERGPISIYMQMNQRRTTERDIPFMEWEYLRKNGSAAEWAPLAVSDETNALTRNGNIQFVGPHDFAHSTHFGKTRYWIRAVNRDGRYDDEDEARNVPRAFSLLMNTTLVVQQETVTDELPQRVELYDTTDEVKNEYFVLSRSPVLSEEVWVDETETISGEDLAALEREENLAEVVRDSGNEIMRVWVRYVRVSHFLNSGPHDRHYTIDRATGRLTFGDGKSGKKPPVIGDDVVRVTYKTGGGKRGNVAMHTINSLQDAIAFVDDVTNYHAASGGCDAGTVEEAIVRGPKLFKHRGRAVTAEDFEWLTREAYSNVAKVRCLPNRNVKLENEPGSLSIVVLPRSGIGEGDHFQELKRTVESYLLQKAASIIAFPGSLQVMEPALLEVGVQATVWVPGMDEVIPTERAIMQKLREFLDPISGGADGRGWDIGEPVHPSMFYALLKSVGPVQYIPQLSIQIIKVENGERVEWHPERLHELPHGVVVSGEHRINVEIKK